MLIVPQTKRMLGITIRERALNIAEVVRSTSFFQVVREAEFELTKDISQDGWEGVGNKLGAFLRANGFEARDVQFGVPAKWLIVRPHQLPPTDLRTAGSILWMHTQTLLSSNLKEVVFDFSGTCSESEGSSVLLVGLQQHLLDPIEQLSRGARLKVIGVAPTVSALASVSNQVHFAKSIGLWLSPDSAELVAESGKCTKMIRHLSAPANLTAVVADLRRALASEVMDSSTPLIVWSENNAHAGLISTIKESLQLNVIQCSVQDTQYINPAAVALAISGLSSAAPQINFLAPRIKAPKSLSPARLSAVSAIAACICVILICLAGMDIWQLKGRVDQANAQLDNLKPAIDSAKPFVSNMQFVESFTGSRVRYLKCLRDVTSAVPTGVACYLTRFDLQSSMQGQLTGRAGSQQDVLNFADNLSRSGRFKSVSRRIDGHATRTGGSEISFAVSFDYVLQ